MSFDHRPIRHRSIVTPIEFDSSSTGNFHDPLINTAITPNCTNDEEIARQHQEQLYAPSLMNTSQPPRAPSIDMRTLEELEADEALARKLQEEEYTRKSIVPNRSYPRGSSNNHRAAPISTINRSRIIQTDAELAAQLQEEEDRKQRQQRLVPPANLNFRRFQNPTNNHFNAPEIVPIPPFNQLRPQSGRRDSSDDSDNDNQPAVRSTRNRPNHLPANRNNNNTIRSQDIFSLFQPIFAGVNRGRHRHLEQMSDDFGPDDYENLLELDKSIEHKPLTSEQINRLPTEKFRRTHAKTTEESTCNICWDEFENDQITRRLPCLHNYHKDCIDKWLKTNNTCPICRIAANQ